MESENIEIKEKSGLERGLETNEKFGLEKGFTVLTNVNLDKSKEENLQDELNLEQDQIPEAKDYNERIDKHRITSDNKNDKDKEDEEEEKKGDKEGEKKEDGEEEEGIQN